MAFPVWNSSGVVPAIRPGLDGTDPDRSPYAGSLVDFIHYLGFSVERLVILEGLLRYRKRLHDAGLTAGFQWLDGSFSENIESSHGRPPNDVDVVTFYEMPANFDPGILAKAHPSLLNHDEVKAHYRVDGYFNLLGGALDSNQVQVISYWYSMWSHRRDGLWKGFVQVDLDPAHDKTATDLIHDLRQQLSAP